MLYYPIQTLVNTVHFKDSLHFKYDPNNNHTPWERIEKNIEIDINGDARRFIKPNVGFVFSTADDELWYWDENLTVPFKMSLKVYVGDSKGFESRKWGLK